MKDNISLSYCLRAAVFIIFICLVYTIYKLGTGIRNLRRTVTAMGPQPGTGRARLHPVKLNRLVK